MKLWLLKQRDPQDKRWPHYDYHDSFVIRAETEAEARQLALRCAFNTATYINEGDDWRDEYNRYHEEHVDYWLSADLTTCVELTTEGVSEVIVGSFNAG